MVDRKWSCGGGHELLSSTYFVNCVYDNGGVLSLKLQGNVPHLPYINELCQLLVIDGPEFFEILPLREDSLLVYRSCS